IENNDLAYERYLKEITNDISLMKSSILRKKILQDVSELFKVSMDSLNNEVGLREDYYQPQSYQMPSVPQFTHLNKQEKAERARSEERRVGKERIEEKLTQQQKQINKR